MKTHWFILIASIAALCSCRHPTPAPHRDDWNDYRKGYNWFERNRDSAFYYFNRVITSPHSKVQLAMAYQNMGRIQSDAGDIFGAQESLSLSLKYLDENQSGNYQYLAEDYTELGIASYNLKDYGRAAGYDSLAIRYAAGTNLIPLITNNLALNLQEQKQYGKALQLYQHIIRSKNLSATEYARVLSNQARARWLANPRYPAATEMRRALNIRLHENDLWGLNSSYRHLADYYLLTQPDSALYFTSHWYLITKRLGSPDDRLKALQQLIRLGGGQPMKRYFMLYTQLQDSVQTARNAAKNQFALIRYEAQKDKAENLRLQKDNSEKRYQIARQQLLLYGSIFVLILGTGLALFWYRRRKMRMEMAAERTIQENQLRVSKKVHDIVANGLYQMMTEIENEEAIAKDELLDRIELMYERSRDISYEKQTSEINYANRLSSLLTSFAGTGRRVALAGNQEQVWEGLTDQAKYELEQVLRELMVNMVKHSRAESAIIKFGRQGNVIQVMYHDNGVGLPKGTLFKNGLTNTGTRIRSINGIINFETGTEDGLSVRIEIPVA